MGESIEEDRERELSGLNNVDGKINMNRIPFRIRLFGWLWIEGAVLNLLSFFWQWHLSVWSLVFMTAFFALATLTFAKSRFAWSCAWLLMSLLAMQIGITVTLLGRLILTSYFYPGLITSGLFLLAIVLFVSDPEIRNRLGVQEKPKKYKNLRIKSVGLIFSIIAVYFLVLNMVLIIHIDGVSGFKGRLEAIPQIHLDSQSYPRGPQQLQQRTFLKHTFLFPKGSKILMIVDDDEAVQERRAINIILKLDDSTSLAISNVTNSTMVAMLTGFQYGFGANGPLKTTGDWLEWAMKDSISLRAYIFRSVGRSHGSELSWIETPGYKGVGMNSSDEDGTTFSANLYAKGTDVGFSFLATSKTLHRDELFQKLKPMIASLSINALPIDRNKNLEARDEVAYLAAHNAEDPFWPLKIADSPVPENMDHITAEAEQELKEGRFEDAKWALLNPLYWDIKRGKCYYLFGRAFFEQGEAKRSIRYLKTAAKWLPHDEQIKKLLNQAKETAKKVAENKK